MNPSICPWYKRAWQSATRKIVLTAASAIWTLTRQKSGWAAEKIIQLQGDAERRVQRVQKQTQHSIRSLGDRFLEQRKRLVIHEQKKIARIKAEMSQLNEAVLKRKVLGRLNAPLS